MICWARATPMRPRGPHACQCRTKAAPVDLQRHSRLLDNARPVPSKAHRLPSRNRQAPLPVPAGIPARLFGGCGTIGPQLISGQLEIIQQIYHPVINFVINSLLTSKSLRFIRKINQHYGPLSRKAIGDKAAGRAIRPERGRGESWTRPHFAYRCDVHGDVGCYRQSVEQKASWPARRRIRAARTQKRPAQVCRAQKGCHPLPRAKGRQAAPRREVTARSASRRPVRTRSAASSPPCR